MTQQQRTAPALIGLLIILAVVPLAAEEPVGPGRPIAVEQLAGTLLTVVPQIDYQLAVLRVSGPDQYALTKAFPAGSPIVVDLLTDSEAAKEGRAPTSLVSLADGRYLYEVVLHLGLDEEMVHAGGFLVTEGVARSRKEVQADLSRVRRELAIAAADQSLQAPSTEGYFVDDFVVVQDLANDSVTSLTLDSDNGSGTTLEHWSVVNGFGNFSIQECGSTYPSTGCQATRLFIEQDTDGEVGINTSTPQGRLHVVGSGNQLILDDNAGSRHGFQQTSTSLLIRNELAQTQVQIRDNAPTSSLVLDAAGAGIGTSSPMDKLHVESTGTQLRLEDSTSGAFHRFSQTSAGLSIFDNNSTTVFISSVAPSNSFVVQLSGIGIGIAAPEAKLHVNGSGIIEGDVALGSSRTIKHQIELLSPTGVLDQIRDLPLYAWKYKDDPAQAPHIGPMAEDVHEAFAIGRDDKHLSPADTAGLALAAIQGVDSEMGALLARLAALEEQVERLSVEAEAGARTVPNPAAVNATTPYSTSPCKETRP